MLLDVGIISCRDKESITAPLALMFITKGYVVAKDGAEKKC